jgi:signal transduction histidine kinase
MATPASIKLNQPLNVLLVEDSQVDQRILEAMLKDALNQESKLRIVSTYQDAVTQLSQDAYDVVVLDLNLPDSRGEETLTKLNAQFPAITIVVNTGAYEDDVGLKSLGLGAQDFLVKGKYNGYTINKVLYYALERKRLELALKSAYEKLKETQAQLVQSEKMKVVGNLATGIAHEVRNPLATILYGITYLDQYANQTDEKVKLILKNIREATDRANHIITDLLDFARLTRLEKTSCRIIQVVEKSLALVSHEIEKNQIQIHSDFKGVLPNVFIDQNKIEQVFVNLILNAIFAMSQGGEIFIKACMSKPEQLSKFFPDKKFNPEEELLRVDVEDTGCGIPEEQLKNIFEPFFTTRRGKGGFGLGLSVSRNIMDLHEGAITIENRKEGGSRATLIFKCSS